MASRNLWPDKKVQETMDRRMRLRADGKVGARQNDGKSELLSKENRRVCLTLMNRK